CHMRTRGTALTIATALMLTSIAVVPSSPAEAGHTLCTVPHVKELSLTAARRQIRLHKLKAKVQNEGKWVYSQAPDGGAILPCGGGVVNLWLRSGPIP
ncbi:MAG: PASTA domain-containing protein, partial [Gammaproteobacteria bacterium]